MSASKLVPGVVLAAYAEPLVEGRRVVLIGDASTSIAHALIDRGARLVHVYDQDAARVAEAAARNSSRNISFAPLSEGGAGVREGAFDVALVENLASFDAPEEIVQRVRRILSPRGQAVFAAPNPDSQRRLLSAQTSNSLSYYAFYDLVAQDFESVRMLGQTPFVGYAVVDFQAEDEPEPALDPSFVPGGAEEPEWFLALAANQPVTLEEFSVIQLPAAGVLDQDSRSRVDEQISALTRSERQARERMAALEAENAQLQAAARADSGDSQERDRLRRQLEERDRWIKDLEARATAADARADDADAELESLQAELARAQTELAQLNQGRAQLARTQAELDELKQGRARSDERIAELSAQRDAERGQAEARAREHDEKAAKRHKQLEGRLQAAEKELAEARSGLSERTSELQRLQAESQRLQAESQRLQAESQRLQAEPQLDDSDDVTRLEAQLRERGEEIAQLQAQLREAKRVGIELLAELAETQRSGVEVPDALKEKLDKLATLNAAREGDLAAARWRLLELESRLEDAKEAQEQANSLERELETARSEVQKQAVLLNQLRGTSR